MRQMVQSSEPEGFVVDGEMIGEDEINALSNVLMRYRVEEPAEQDRERLLSVVSEALLRQEAEGFRAELENARRSSPEGERGIIRSVLPQIGLVRPALWLAGLTVVVLAIIATVLSGTEGSLPILVVAPLLAGVAMAYLQRANRSMAELESACPIDLYEATTARLFLILSFSLVALGAAGVLLWLQGSAEAPIILILSFLVPLTFLCWLSLYLSLRFGFETALAGVLGAWTMLFLISLLYPEQNLFALAEGTGQVVVRLAILCFSMIAVVVTLLNSGRLLREPGAYEDMR